MTTYDGIDAVDWLRAVLDGVVPGYKCETTLHNLMSVSFPCYEIASFRDQIHAHWGWISGRAFAWQQGMDFETIRQWVGLGLIQPTVAFLVDMWFDHKELAQLAEERALSERGQSQYL